MVLNGLPERYEHFVVQESFNPAGSFVELRTRLTNYEESRQHREKLDDDDSHVAMASKRHRRKPKSLGKYNAAPKLSTGQTCYCCGIKGHVKADCFHKDKAECNYCKMKGHFEKACMKKAESSKGGKHGSLASSLKSGGSSEATAKDLVVDSGSTDHVIVNKNWFKNFKEIETTVTNPDGGNTSVLGIGEVEVLAKDVKGKTKSLVLRKALFVPGYRTNLISVSRIVDNGHTVVHDAKNNFLCLKSKEKFPIKRKGNLFFLRMTPKQGNHFANLSGGSNEAQLWHKRFEHVNYRDLKTSVSRNFSEIDEKCETCCLAKITKTPVPKRSENKATKARERVFSDVVGPITPSSKDGFKYFVTFVDEYSSHACVKFMRHKNQVLQKFKEYIAECGTPRILRSDNGTEYTNKNFKKFCNNNKIKTEYTVPETPEQNGVAERYNRTVVETARSLLIESKLPKCYWLRAVDTAAYVRNLVKKDQNEKTPYEKFWGKKPKIDHLKVFGCLAYVKNRKREKSKFDAKARKHVFLGYDGNSTAYLLQDIKTRKLTRARNVVFNEKKVVGFTNEAREDENDDLLFDVTFDESENNEPEGIPGIEVKDESPEVEVKVENVTDEENSSSSESESNVDTTNPILPNSKVQVQELTPSRTDQNFQARPSRIPVLQERFQTSSDVQRTPQGVRPKTKVPSKLELTGEYLKIAIPSSEKVLHERWDKYYEMKDARKEAKELKREDRSRNPPQRYGQSYSHNSTFFPKEPETYEEAVKSIDSKNGKTP